MSEPEIMATDGGTPPGGFRESYLADEYHDRFIGARELISEGTPPVDAAEQANLPLYMLMDALDGDSIQTASGVTCASCGGDLSGEWVHVSAELDGGDVTHTETECPLCGGDPWGDDGG